MSTEPDNFTWLVKARTLNQEVLLRLYRFAKTSREQRNPISRSVFPLLVGAGFSLWRAAFLGDATRESPKITEHATKLLERLIRDNAVGYQQDRDMREWMGGYYTNNAIWRLLMAWTYIEKQEDHQPMPHALLRLKDFEDRGSEQESIMELWNYSHEAITALLDTLDDAK